MAEKLPANESKKQSSFIGVLPILTFVYLLATITVRVFVLRDCISAFSSLSPFAFWPMVVAHGLIILASAFVAVLFFFRGAYFPLVYVVYALLTLTIAFVLAVTVGAMPSLPEAFHNALVADLAISVCYAMAIIPYYHVSKRVKRVFINR